MKALITGGAGFIGSHITERLMAGGYEAIVVDDLSSGTRDNLPQQADFHLINICNRSISGTFKREKPDIVIHCAAQSKVKHSILDPLHDAKNNVLGSINIFQNCCRCQVGKLIYLSSAAVYGQPSYLGIDEHHPTNPLSFYGLSKLVAEQYLHSFSSFYGLNFTILRLANVYGPRQRDDGEGGVITNFISNILKKQKPVIYGDGNQTRDFISVMDVASAVLRSVDLANGQILNIGTGRETSINMLLTLLAQHLGQDIKPGFSKRREGDILSSRLENSKAMELLGWAPEYSLEKGLGITIEYYLSR